MKSDFHYCAIYVLTRAAGYSPGQARTVATASQYVDDCHDGSPRLVGGRIFDPVMTLPDWRGQVALSGHLSIQAQVYVPFHFLSWGPAARTFAGRLVEDAQETPGPYGLIKLGLALHAYADSFAHQGFSGRWEGGNQVERLEVLNGYPPPWESLAGVAWPVGHAQAGTIPDLGWAHWRAHMASGEVIERDNPEVFMAAARAILRLLAGSMTMAEREKFAAQVRERGTENERFAAWREAWEIPPYSPEAWEAEARAAGPETLLVTPWAYFHRAAREHRSRVMTTFGLL